MQVTYKQHIVFLFILCGIVLFISHKDSARLDSSRIVTRVEATQSTPALTTPVSKGKYQYLEITTSCGPEFQGHCFHAYAGPGTEYKELADLRNGMVLKIKKTVQVNGQTWHQVYFDEWLRYPDRVEGDWYIQDFAGRVVSADGAELLTSNTPKTTKRIVVDLSEHMIYAYDGNENFLTTKMASGVDATPTPTGTFTIYKKMPSRYMQGPLPGVNDEPFDLPGTPWNMYFTQGGAVIHGAYWHNFYGTEQSSGCINLPPELAKILYDWVPLGTTVTIRN